MQQFQDLELTRRSQEGDTEAFGELVTKYRTKIFTLVYGIVRNEHDARDIVQEGFLKAWQSIQRFEGRSSFYTWLYSLILVFGLDITQRKQAEAELHRTLAREKELGQLRSNFVSMVSHEFRTPLAIIQSSAEILSRYFERLEPTERKEQLQSIVKNAQRMGEMMEGILVLSRLRRRKSNLQSCAD